jgi:hypothetical protein
MTLSEEGEQVMTGRPLATLELGADDQQALRTLAKRRTTAQALALRARIVLACAAGEANQSVAAKLETMQCFPKQARRN